MVKWNIWKKITETISKSKARLDGQSNAVKVLCAGAMSVIIFVLAYFVAIKNSNSNSNGNSVGYWNFIILIVSAPVAFVIWHFRDENNRQQIENQRKDINLKEFQKLSEWVSGAHLPEIKTVSKTTQKSSSKDGAEIIEQTTELSEEYAKKPDTRIPPISIHSANGRARSLCRFPPSITCCRFFEEITEKVSVVQHLIC